MARSLLATLTAFKPLSQTPTTYATLLRPCTSSCSGAFLSSSTAGRSRNRLTHLCIMDTTPLSFASATTSIYAPSLSGPPLPVALSVLRRERCRCTARSRSCCCLDFQHTQSICRILIQTVIAISVHSQYLHGALQDLINSTVDKRLDRW